MFFPGSSILLLVLKISSASIVALALCTGHPAGCCGHVRSSCEGIDGCSWIPATTGNTLYGSCEGAPLPCENFSDDHLACLKQDGCTFGPNQEWSFAGTFCTGNSKAAAQCIGTVPTLCSGGEKSVCESVLGCTFIPGDYWFDGECTGTPTPCAILSNDECSCNQQMRCIYYQDPPDPTEEFYDAIMPVREGYRECYGPDDMYVEVSPNEFLWTNSVVMCEKCRPTSLGRDVCYWVYMSWNPSLAFHSCVMKIGDQYCSCEICEEGGTAFNCQGALESYGGLDGSTNVVVGRDCSGNCIWSNDPTLEPTVPTQTTPDPTTDESTTAVPTEEAPSNVLTSRPTISTQTTPDPTTDESTTAVPTEEAPSNILTSRPAAEDGSFGARERLAFSLVMLVVCIAA